MNSGGFALLVPIVAMIVYAVFAYLRRATRDPEKDRAQLAETDRRLTEIDREAERDRQP